MRTRFRAIVFLALLLVDIISQYTHVSSELLGFVAAIAWLAALPAADGVSRNLSLLLWCVGAALFVRGKVPLNVVVSSFGENIGVLMVMTLVPLMGIAIDLGQYPEALRLVSKRIKNPVYLFLLSLFLAYFIGSVLLTTSIALVWMILVPAVAQIGKRPSEFLSDSLPRGYDASLLWTPIAPSMAATLAVTHTRWPSVFAPGMALSVIVLVCAVVAEWGSAQLKRADASAALSPCKSDGDEIACKVMENPSRRLAGLAIGLGLFIGAAAFMSLSGLTVYQSMVPCVAAGLLIWASCLGRLREAVRMIPPFFTTRVPGLSNQFLLMVTAGFIGRAVQIACKDTPMGFLSGLPRLGPFGFVLVVSFLVWGIAIAGIHPIIGTSIVYSVVSPYAGQFAGLPMTLALLVGSCLGFSVSPVSATMLVTSSCAGKNTVDVGLKKHWRFLLLSWVLCSLAIPLLVKTPRSGC